MAKEETMAYAAQPATREARGTAAPSTAAYGTAPQNTFPRLLATLAGERPEQTALQEKRYGIWQPITWRQYDERVRDFAHGLAALGVERGEECSFTREGALVAGAPERLDIQDIVLDGALHH